ncbi:hypothetical protein E2562_028065 [Oryza meyeriana var. granulata]|uniref:DC1 domain-containing protein n=1 Tax=Oryza meyeriana var. granulata TaxID=110450 RepID=A0A6G1BZS0_9ORYZ|nr:hypothetical protein E2562_028065 [Oryza meyeriana var. granulata]
MEREIAGHRLHPSCTLVLKGDGDAFTCAACKRESSHAYRYSCDSCRFDLHGQCATSPDSFSFWGHPHHPLTLVSSGPDLAGLIRSRRPDVAEALVESSPASDGRIPAYCDICTNEIQGMHYQCTPCGVFLHPVCVHLPATVPSSEAHPEHELTLLCTFPTMCRACGSPGTWAYRCFHCLTHFHANCIPENHYMLGPPYESNGLPDRRRQFGIILPPKPPPPPKFLVNKEDPFAAVNPLGIMDPFTMPRRGPSTTPSVRPDPWGGAFPFSGEYGRSTFGQGA